MLPAAVATSNLAWSELPPIIPRAVLFGHPDKDSPILSPDGQMLAHLAPDEQGVMAIWLRHLTNGDDRLIASLKSQSIRRCWWTPDTRQILFLPVEQAEDEQHLYAVDIETGRVRDLTPYPGVHARFAGSNLSIPDRVLVALNRRDPEFHDVYRLDLKTGELTLEAQNDMGFAGWTADLELKVRAGIRVTPNGGTELMVRDTTSSPWRSLVTWSPKDVVTSGPISFTPDGKSLYIVSSRDANAGGLRKISLATGHEEILSSSQTADVSKIVVHPTNHRIQAVGFYKETLHWRILDQSIAKDFKVLRRIGRGDFNVIGRDASDHTWLVEVSADDAPIYYYLYNRKTRHVSKLFSNRKALETTLLARMVPVGFRARDGLKIHAYLTTPPGVPAKKLPTVVLVHDGPWARDTKGYNPEAQWLANRGYAVLQINYRGSTGYGKAHINAADRQWGGTMQNDLIDGVRWAVHQGITNPKRVALFGTRYGGYAALAGLAFTPKFYRCAVELSGPGNLITYLENLPDYVRPVERLIWDRIGHPVKDAANLRRRSPFFAGSSIIRPLLIGHGKNDSLIDRKEVLAFVSELQSNETGVQFVEYDGEGHGLAQPQNQLDFYAQAERFLAHHLGGRYER